MKTFNLMLSTAIASMMLAVPVINHDANAATIRFKPQIMKVKPKVKIKAVKIKIKPKVKIKIAKIKIKPKVKIKIRTANVRVKAKFAHPVLKLNTKRRVALTVQALPKAIPVTRPNRLPETSTAVIKPDVLTISPPNVRDINSEDFRRLEDMREIGNLSDHNGELHIPGLDEWGTGSGDDGNRSNIPVGNGLDNDSSGKRSNIGDTAGRLGPDYSDVALDLLGRVSKNLNSGEKLGGKVAAAPSPGDALGGIASQVTVQLPGGPYRSTGPWQDTDTSGRIRVTRYGDPSGTTVRIDTITASGRKYTTFTFWSHSGNDGDTIKVTDSPPPNRRIFTASEKVDPGKDIAKQQDPNSEGTAGWITPSCGSAECNRMRALLKNPQSEFQKFFDRSKVFHGGRDGERSSSGARHQLTVDQHGLVASYGVESDGPHTGGGKPMRFENNHLDKVKRTRKTGIETP